ncbi:hypothetical protein, conserved [Trypanosoma brucei brucei TREU927]|uniref:Pre-rRNA-processing protein Ipi1 N-terminal domain-containing protein n=1 Tax=Trypanosoma brucei brucei (strain 927/4 GUTat10.1) TaxID=185431 RepID=Q38ES4_TRYB2|nr:hypothetical protein, conserved [Trypanosoma brucei brucei TREU927]EAN76696.1 hypothetical protein, conserved [Trypanosoma brucei brucei TREU927]
MVRVKEKARKGDDAFKTRKQKVGRKKLAPATATRAEVHARTLRVTTPTAITRGILESEAVRTGENCQTHKGEKEKRVVSADQLHRDFKEHLAGTRHYKKVVRSTSFASLTRAVAGHFSAVGRADDSSAMGNETQLSPLEILYAYTGALDAMTDTDDDVRRAALGTLKVILYRRKPAAQIDEQGSGAMEAGGGSATAFNVDQARAALRVVDVTLTHAMVSVRRSGVELLQLILQVQPLSVRAVLSESTTWVKMAGRISSIVLPSTSNGSGNSPSTKMFHVVADLLETMIPLHRSESDAWNQGCPRARHAVDEVVDKQGESNVSLSALVAQFFDECSPRWCVAWKELMELRAALFRDVEWVRHATALARAFACCAMYLWDHRLLGRKNSRLMHHLFTVKVPFTMHELIAPRDPTAESGCGVGNGSKWRVELANAIANACLPLAAANDDTWEVLHNFLSISFHCAKDSDSSDGTSSAGESGKSRRATQLVGPVRTLRTAVVRLHQALLPRLLPIASPLLQIVMQATNLSDSSETDRLALVDVLLMSADVFSSFVTSQVAVQNPQNIRYLRDVVLVVPRFFFALRGLQMEAACLDRIVFSFLYPLWRVVSSGHPLLSSPMPNKLPGGAPSSPQVNKENKQKITALQLLARSLTSLFEIRVPDSGGEGTCRSVAGVLQRCSDRTVELAVHTLFYVGATVPPTSWTRENNVLSLPTLVDTLPRPGVCA